MHRVAALIVSIVSSLLWLGLPPAALAQSRDKWFAEFGLGPASFDSSPPLDAGSGATPGVSYFTLGGWLNPRWQLGFELGTASFDTSGQMTPGWYAGVIAYYPWTTSGFHVKGRVGATTVLLDIVDEFGETTTISLGTGPSLMAGAGWDVRLWRRLWLTPAVNARYGWPGDLVMAGRTSVPGWKFNTVDFTVGVRFD